VPQPPVSPPSGGVAGETAVSPPAELRITKVVKPRRITLGHSARWKVTVRNLGPVDARAVTLVERSRVGRAALKLHPSRGRCRGTPPRFCVIGRLKPGQRATVTVTARPRHLGRIHNVVAVNSITRQRTTRGKRASATAVVVPAAAPRFTG
jgi:large repetitive protein